jgi:hypothetical protein
LLVASLSFYTFERSFLSLKERFGGQGDSVARAQAQPDSIVEVPLPLQHP